MADQIGPSTDIARQGLHGRLMLSDTLTKHGAYAEVFIPEEDLVACAHLLIMDTASQCPWCASCRDVVELSGDGHTWLTKPGTLSVRTERHLENALVSVRRVIDEQNAAGPAPDAEPAAVQAAEPSALPPEFNPVVLLNAKIAELFHGQTANTIVEALTSLTAWAVMSFGDPKLPTDVRCEWMMDDVRAKIRVAKVRGITGGNVPIV